MSSSNNIVAICVATYKRPDLLSNCLNSIGNIEKPDGFTPIIIVVDNDKARTAESTFNREIKNVEMEAHYYVESNRGISSARNKLIEKAIIHDAAYIGFIDDDEFSDSKWLTNHLKALDLYNADIVSGPVIPAIPTHEVTTTNKINVNVKRPTGHAPRHVAAGNVLFKSSLVTVHKLRFDTYYNFIGGEDFDFFDRAAELGLSKIWCSEAIVYEAIAEERRTKKYLFYRHFTGGINNVLYFKKKRPALVTWSHFLIKSLGKLFDSLFIFIISILTLNKKRFERSIIKLASASGYISGLLNIVVERYR